jgi:hypothetical protein
MEQCITKMDNKVKRNFKVFPDSVADFNLQVLITLSFLLFPDFVAQVKGICALGVIAFPSKRGGTLYDGIPFNLHCGASTHSICYLSSLQEKAAFH